MPRKRPQVLGVDLNRSESRRQLAPSEPRPILVQIRAPDERDVAGVIARGYYRHTDTKLRVYDTEGALLGSADLRPGDNVEAAARKPLKEKCGGTGFYAPISYSRRSMHYKRGAGTARGPCLCQRRAPGSTAQKPGFGKPRFLSTGTEGGKSHIGRWARFHIPGVDGSSGASADSSPVSTNPLDGLSELTPPTSAALSRGPVASAPGSRRVVCIEKSSA